LIKLRYQSLDGSTGDEEPLVNGRVNWGWWVVLASRNVRRVNAVGVVKSGVSQCDLGGWVPSTHQLQPRFMGLSDDLVGILLVLALSGESELILRLSIRNLIDTEPLIGSPEETREMTLYILNVIELGCQWVLLVNDDNLPISFLLIEKGHDAKNFDTLNLTGGANEFSNFTDIERVVVTFGLGLRVDVLGIFPGLRECTIIPEVTLVREAVADITELALLDVLLDWVEGLFLADLHLGVCPSRDLDDHVAESLLLIGVERDIVERGDGGTVLLDEDTVIEGVGLPNFPYRVCHWINGSGEVAGNKGGTFFS